MSKDKQPESRETTDEKQKRTDEFFEKLVWELTSCDEATTLFPDMTVCPVCNAMLTKVEMTDAFVMVHKSLEELYN